MTTNSHPAGYSFAGRILDVHRGVLRCRGRRIELGYRPLAVLIYLVHHRSRVVTREEMVSSVWGLRYLSENALSQAVSRLRWALRDRKLPHRFIVTCYRGGYRFVAPARELDSSELDLALSKVMKPSVQILEPPRFE